MVSLIWNLSGIEIIECFDASDYSFKRSYFNHRHDFVFLYCHHHRFKINRAVSDSDMGIFFSIVIVKMVMPGWQPEKLRKTEIQMCMTYIQRERSIPYQGKFIGVFKKK